MTKILDVKAQLKSTKVPQGGCSSASDQGSGLFFEFQIVPDGSYWSLAQFGNKFAILTKKMCTVLRAALSGRQLRLRAYVQSKEWFSAVKSWQNNKNFLVLTGEINVYGAREIADEVGRVLSTFDTFLQQPRYGLDGIAYYNPHYFRIPGFSDANSLDMPILAIENTISVPVQNTRPESNPSLEVTSILDGLSHHEFLNENVVDRRIRSALLS